MVDAIIQDRFKQSPGRGKVLSGEYELFNALDCDQTFDKSECTQLRPGMSLKMAMAIGQHKRYYELKHCPRPGCLSLELRSSPGGGRIW